MAPVDSSIFDELESRMGRYHLGRRLRLQVDHSMRFFGKGYGRFHWENSEILPVVLEYLLRSVGLIHRGRRNAIDYRLVKRHVLLRNLPRPFDGFRILHLSDVHVDGIPDGGEKLRGVIRELQFDLCVITGDFRFETFGASEEALSGMERLVEAVRCPCGVLGILGNHDFIEMVPELEALGIRILLNESVRIEKEGAVIQLVGLDDPHFYGVHSIDKAFHGISDEDVTILLVHSPELYSEAAQAGADYYLCGHTHGGQICLPGEIPIYTNAGCPRKYTSGAWRYEHMAGYTSRGVGASGLFVRYFCPPEVAVHELRCVPR